jgi:hypothetical protein
MEATTLPDLNPQPSRRAFLIQVFSLASVDCFSDTKPYSWIAIDSPEQAFAGRYANTPFFALIGSVCIRAGGKPTESGISSLTG